MRYSLLLGCVIIGTACGAGEPELDFVFPAGGQQASEFEVEVGGAMSSVTHAAISGEGVKATLIGAPREVTYSRKGKPVVTLVPNRYRFKVTVEKDAKPGLRTFRVGTAYRLSEPQRFEISLISEVREAFTNRATVSEVSLNQLPVCLNGRAYRNGTDRYRFQAAKGMTLVAYTEGQVQPNGPFRPVLAFSDEAGKPCEGVTVYDADTAPVAVFEVPQDGSYLLSVACSTGKGGNGSVYRIKLGELPLVTGFSPLGAQLGESLNVRLVGHNLPQKRVRLFTGGKNSDLCLGALVGDAYALPGLRFDLSEEPEVDEKEPNDDSETAQALSLPSVVNGDLEAAGSRDIYRFSGKKGEALYVDVRAEALGSPLKPHVTVRNAKGETVVSGDFDSSETIQAAVCGRDPSVAVTLPEDGAYEVEVADLEGRSGSDLVYRLRVGPPQPDYRLWMTPASLNIPSDGSALVTLHLHRIHGFDGEVKVKLDYPPLSIACEGGVISADAVMGKMTVSTEGVRFPRTVFGLSLTGTAQIGGRDVMRSAVPITFGYRFGKRMTLQAYSELSAKVGYGARSLRVDPLGKGGVPVDPRIPMPVAFKEPVPVSTQEPVRLTVLSATMATHLGGLYVPVVVWPPQGFAVTGVQPTNKQERAGVLLKADAAVMKAGQTGYFILGCTTRGDTNRTVSAVTQSVPYVIR
jgi:hypothetical protein